MRTASKLLLTAAPALAVGYVLFTGYLLNRVRPVPITAIPDHLPDRRTAADLTPV